MHALVKEFLEILAYASTEEERNEAYDELCELSVRVADCEDAPEDLSMAIQSVAEVFERKAS